MKPQFGDLLPISRVRWCNIDVPIDEIDFLTTRNGCGALRMTDMLQFTTAGGEYSKGE